MANGYSTAPDTRFKYAFVLQGNARVFIESAVEYARQDYRENWKFAVLHLNTALELLLKARLAMEDHRLLAKGKAWVNERAFDEGHSAESASTNALTSLSISTNTAISSQSG